MDTTNDTISLADINTILPLISLMSAHCLVNSFTLISDVGPSPAVLFMKSASNYYLETRPGESGNDLGRNAGEGYIVYDKRDFDLSKLVQTKPKLIVAVYKTRETTPLGLKFITELSVPPPVLFFIVLLAEDPRSETTAAKCFRFHKPSPEAPPKSFPVMRYRGGSDQPEWIWESEQTNWNSLEKETRNMREVTVTIGLASLLEKDIVIQRFWAGKNSFFWKLLEEHLNFRIRVHFEKVPIQEVKNMEKIYLTQLETVADGLGVLPVMTSKRFQQLKCIPTGLDSKNHIMVRSPQYIHSWQSIFKPFAPDSWLCLGIAFVLTTVALKIVTFSPNIPSSDFSGCFLTIVGIICGQGCPNIPERLSVRMVCYTCIFFSILIYQFYTSNFYSLLSTKVVTLPFSSLEQFVARKTHSMYVHPDTAIYADIKKATNGPLKKLWDDFLSKDPSHKLRSDTRVKAFERVCGGKGAIFGLPFQTVNAHDLMCKLVTINSGYYPTNIATAVRKNFPFTPQFQFVHLKLLEAGVSHKYRDEELKVERQNAYKTEVTNEPVSLEHVAFLFVFHSAFVLLSCLLLGLEVISSKIFNGGKNTLKGRVNKMP